MSNSSHTDFRKEILLETSSYPGKPRSIYSSLSYQETPTYPRFNDSYNYYDGTLLDQDCSYGPELYPTQYYQPMWGLPSHKNKLSYFPEEKHCIDPYLDPDSDEKPPGVFIATEHGTMVIRLPHRMRIDMTIDRAIRILNFKTNVTLTLNASGSSAAIIHPNGRVYQYGSRVEMLARDVRGNNKFAKMWYKGISFTSQQCALVYLVDSAGTRTTTDTFLDLTKDFSMNVFYNESRHGPMYHKQAISYLKNAQYFCGEKGTHNWIINNIKITQSPDGLLKVARNSNKYFLRCSATNGSATITTPFVHATASSGHTSHLFVRRGERRMHFDGLLFIVRNAGHSSGFDERNMLKVF
uniref:Uncharacterized protein n=1 Tax=Clastoptera arizonana TaxID=38151 RepID=A0A1B6E0L1_9HEMI